jgi:hypothetical protein
MKLLGIISVGFDVTDQLLIRFYEFVRYWRKNGSTIGIGVVKILMPKFKFPFMTKRQAYGVQLAWTISLYHYFVKKLLMLNDTLMKYSIHFSLISHLQKKDSVIYARWCDSTHS